MQELGIVLPRRACPGHRGGQQRWLHGRTPSTATGPVQRHRELELTDLVLGVTNHLARCPPTDSHRRRGIGGTGWCLSRVLPRLGTPPWPTRGIHGAAVRSLTWAGPSAQRCLLCSASDPHHVEEPVDEQVGSPHSRLTTHSRRRAPDPLPRARLIGNSCRIKTRAHRRKPETAGLSNLAEAAHENEPRLAVPSCHGRR